MNPAVDLRCTLGWHITGHARNAAANRQVTIRDILEVIAAPEVTYTASHYGDGRYVYQRGIIALAVHQATRAVLTVLWRTSEDWDDHGFAAAMDATQRGPETPDR